MASFSDTKITPANGQKLPTVDGSTTGYTETQELKAYILNEKAQPNGIASLDSTGKLPSTQLPDFANDVLAFDSIASFPATGTDGVLYIAKDTNTLYRWTGTQYVQLTADISGKEDKSNKVTSITPASTDEQYPSAKAVYEETARLEEPIKEISTDLGELETEVDTLKAENTQQAKDIAMLKFANEGKTYIMEESDRDGYSVDVKPATVTGEAFGEAVLKSMEGRDVCWNQLGRDVTITGRGQSGLLASLEASRRYYVYLKSSPADTATGNSQFQVYGSGISIGGEQYHITSSPKEAIVTSMTGTLRYTTYDDYSLGEVMVTCRLVDLTQMYGSDAPTTLSDPRIAELKAYLAEHPEYNAGTIVNNNVESVVSRGASGDLKGTLSLPSICSNLHGLPTARDKVGFVNRTYENMNSIDLGSLNWVKDTSGSAWAFYTNDLMGDAVGNATITANALSSEYTTVASNSNIAYTMDKTVFVKASGQMFIVDRRYSDASSFKSAMAGKTIHYEATSGGQRYEARVLERKVNIVTFDGSSDENWSKYGDGRDVYIIPISALKSSTSEFVCDRFTPSANAWTNDSVYAYKMGSNGANSTDVFFNMVGTGIADVTAWRSWLAQHPVTVVYRLALPTTPRHHRPSP